MATTLNSEIFDRSHSRRAPYVRTLLTFLFQLFLYVSTCFFSLIRCCHNHSLIRMLDVDFSSEGGRERESRTKRNNVEAIHRVHHTTKCMKNKTFQNQPIHRSIHFTRWLRLKDFHVSVGESLRTIIIAIIIIMANKSNNKGYKLHCSGREEKGGAGKQFVVCKAKV